MGADSPGDASGRTPRECTWIRYRHFGAAFSSRLNGDVDCYILLERASMAWLAIDRLPNTNCRRFGPLGVALCCRCIRFPGRHTDDLVAGGKIDEHGTSRFYGPLVC